MLIQSQLRLFSVIALILLLAMISSLIWSYANIARSSTMERHISEIQMELFDLTILRDDYLFMQSDRARKQWLEKVSILEDRIAKLDALISDPEHREVCKEMLRDSKASALISQRLETLQGNGSLRPNEEAAQRLLSQLLVRTHALNRNIDYLSGAFRDEVARAEATRRTILAVSMGIITVTIILYTWHLSRLLARRIRSLHRGLQTIGAGDLSYRLPEQGSDELADLAKTGNKMVSRLKTSLISNTMLEKEIHERTETEQKLREALTELGQFRKAMDHVTSFIYIKDLQSRYVFANRPTLDLFGCNAEELTGSDDFRFFPPETAHRLREIDARVFAGESTAEEIAVDGPSMEHRVYWEVKTPMYDADGSGTIRGLLGISTDITDRKNAEEALRQNREFLQAIISSSPLPIISIDLAGNVTSWNASAQLVFGWKASEVLGSPLPIIPPEQQVPFAELQGRMHSGEHLSGMRTVRQKKNGDLIDVSLSVAPIRNAQGEVVGNVKTLEDITDRLRADNEKQQLREQLIQAQKTEMIGRLAGGIAHDFNNALAIVFLSLEVLKNLLGKHPETHEPLSDLEIAAARARDVTQQLLAFSRKQMITPEVVDVNQRISSLLKSFGRLLGDDIIVHLDLHADPPTVFIDPTQGDQMLMNLTLNARDAMPKGGELFLETRLRELNADACRQHPDLIPGTYVETVVRDTGCGISPEDLPLIFEPFFTTKEIGKGTGLGLPSVYGMVIQNKGYIEVDSSIGTGSAFRIGFPLHVSEPHSTDSDDTMVYGKGSILLVEDEEILCRATRVALELIGYTVTATGDPLEAARLVEDGHQFDLLLSDVVMPVMSGIVLRETIMPFLPHIRTIFMSGYHSENAAAPDTDDRFTVWIRKPFSMPALSRIIHELLHKQETNAVQKSHREDS